MRRQPRKVSRLSSAFAYRFALEPGDHPHDIHGCGCEELLEVRAREAEITTLPEIKASDALREAALYPRPEGILGLERGRSLALARGLESFVVGLGPDCELPGASCAVVHALRAGHTRQAARSKRMRMTGSPETSWPGVHLTLVCP